MFGLKINSQKIFEIWTGGKNSKLTLTIYNVTKPVNKFSILFYYFTIFYFEQNKNIIIHFSVADRRLDVVSVLKLIIITIF